jgi:flavin-dependent thymidylate synthase
MRVKLAGFNVDAELLRRLAGGADLTPETLSAAYARISRSPLAIDTLRRQACRDVGKARRSNQRIIFAMGHHSVAEHAVFNFDLIGVSRLALEEIEHFRLASFTEKSQRYVTLENERVLPGELRDPALRALFQQVSARQFRFYFKAFARLHRRLRRQHAELAAGAAGQRLVEGWAKEDARYVLPLAAGGQVGMTVNARALEHMFRRWRLSPRAEVRRLAARLHALVMPVAPSLILFPEPSAFDRESFAAMDGLFAALPVRAARAAGRRPRIVAASEGGDDAILAARLAVRRGLGLERARALVAALAPGKKRALFRDFFARAQFFSAMPREFEMADVTFQATVSASCFAQLKRHRMATLLAGAYDPGLGVTLPPSFAAAGLENEFRRIISASDAAYCRLQAACPAAADYILTNAHRRCVLMRMNLRELYHFVRLRDDEHAQWDIRALANDLAGLVRRRMPLAAMLLCGKSRFAGEYETIYGTRPEEPAPA